MRNALAVFFLVFFLSCDDGDIITVNIDFDYNLSQCENNSDSYFIYNTKDDPSEAVIVVFPRNTTNELFFTEATSENQTPLIVDGSSIRFIYRTYNRNITGTGTNSELCDAVIPADLTILEDYEAASGAEILITSTVIDDDEDGVPTEFEGADPNGDGDFSDSLDTDGDGIFDYLDDDDDNDNVLTRQELNNDDTSDEDPNTNPLDTDGDGTPDYLDTDDDNDMVLTIDEDANGVNGPIDDTVVENGVSIPLFRSALETISYPNPGLRTDNDYLRTVTLSFVVQNFNIEILQQDVLSLGTLTNSFQVELDD